MDRPIDIVITMGGLGSRFRKAGYTTPKYMIEAKGKTLFEWSLISLKGFQDQANQYIFIAMRLEEADAEGFIREQCRRGDGFIPCCQAEGDHWSFVRLDDAGKVAEIREKKRISNYCTLGAYYFRTCQLYADLYHEYYDRERELVNGEKYVAPLYDYLLGKGGEIYISDVPPEKVHVLGTPEELQVFLNS